MKPGRGDWYIADAPLTRAKEGPEVSTTESAEEEWGALAVVV
jgi:hypothetical protein